MPKIVIVHFPLRLEKRPPILLSSAVEFFLFLIIDLILPDHLPRGSIIN